MSLCAEYEPRVHTTAQHEQHPPSTDNKDAGIAPAELSNPEQHSQLEPTPNHTAGIHSPQQPIHRANPPPHTCKAEEAECDPHPLHTNNEAVDI